MYTDHWKVTQATSAAREPVLSNPTLPASVTFQFSCLCQGIFSAHAPTKVVNSKQRFFHQYTTVLVHTSRAPPWLSPPVAQYSMFIHSGTLYLKPLANCYTASAFDLVDCQSTSSAWWAGLESNQRCFSCAWFTVRCHRQLDIPTHILNLYNKHWPSPY